MRRKTRILAYLAMIAILCAVIAALSFVKRGRDTEGPAEENSSTAESTVTDDGKKTLVMAVEVPLDAPYGKLAAAYKENVESMSGGALSIEIYENGLLGFGEELLRSIGEDSNAADIMLVPIRDLADAGCMETGKILEPYSFDGHDGFLALTVSKDAQALLLEPKDRGVGATGLFFAEDGFRHLFLKENGEGIQGKRIAGGADEENAAYVEGIGGVYDYLPSVDIKEAIVNGSLDGVEQDLIFYQENALWEAAPCIVADSHLASPCEVVIKLDAAEKLTAIELDLLKKAGEAAVKTFTNDLEAEDQTMFDEFAGHGAEVVKFKE